MRWWGLLFALALSACGGGNPQPVGPPFPVRTDLEYGYFETADGQLAETQKTVTFLHLQDDSAYGDPAARQWREDQMISRLEEAQELGYSKVILSVGFLLFDAKYHYVGMADASAFEAQLKSLGMLPLIQWLYVVDEPETHGINDATMLQAEHDLRAAWPGPKLVVVYSTQGPTPGISGLDIVGRDDYAKGIGVTGELPSISASQRYVLLPGGADPWRIDPTPFLAYADGHPEVAIIWPFIWGSYPFGGTTYAGIVANGEAPVYQKTGCRITRAC